MMHEIPASSVCLVSNLSNLDVKNVYTSWPNAHRYCQSVIAIIFYDRILKSFTLKVWPHGSGSGGSLASRKLVWWYGTPSRAGNKYTY